MFDHVLDPLFVTPCDVPRPLDADAALDDDDGDDDGTPELESVAAVVAVGSVAVTALVVSVVVVVVATVVVALTEYCALALRPSAFRRVASSFMTRSNEFWTAPASMSRLAQATNETLAGTRRSAHGERSTKRLYDAPLATNAGERTPSG